MIQGIVKAIYLCPMKIENSKIQMRRGILEFCILALLKERELYPSDLMKELSIAQLNIVEGTLYPLLTRLKNEGYLHYRWEESKSGPPRKYYTLTPLGQEFLAELQQTWNEMISAVNSITQSKQTTHE